jgi:hypothetical protein
MDTDNGHKSVYYKDKAAYNQALLDAIKDARKQRVDDPGRGFPNAVLALENILFSDEKEKINNYKYDPLDHEKELQEARDKAKGALNESVAIEIYLNEIKLISWPVYRRETENYFKLGIFPDLDGNGQIDRKDITIAFFEALLSKIICILQEGGWLTWESEGDVMGGGGGGLKDKQNGEVDVDDDLAP